MDVIIYYINIVFSFLYNNFIREIVVWVMKCIVYFENEWKKEKKRIKKIKYLKMYF